MLNKIKWSIFNKIADIRFERSLRNFHRTSKKISKKFAKRISKLPAISMTDLEQL